MPDRSERNVQGGGHQAAASGAEPGEGGPTGVTGVTGVAVSGPGRVGVRHLAGLDGLRGLAVVLVVVFHFWPEVLPGGFLGVSLFFTLSGYLITSLLLTEHERHGRIDLRAFWGRRFRRLLPAALLTLAVVAVLGRWLSSPPDLAEQVAAAVGYVYNWYLVATGGDYGALFAQPSPIEHFWSLAIEEQFYVVFPLVAAVALRVGRRCFTAAVVVLLSASVALCLAEVVDPAVAYFSTATRAAEILVGALLAVLVPLHRLPEWGRGAGRTVLVVGGVVAIAALVVASRLTDYAAVVSIPWFLPATALVSATAVAFSGSSAADRWLGSATLAWLGRRSYGIYLIHWPIEVWLDAPGLVKVAVTLGLAEVSFRVIESPVRLRQVLVEPRRAGAVTLACAIAVVGVTVLPTAGGGEHDLAMSAEEIEVPAGPSAGALATPADPVEPGAGVDAPEGAGSAVLGATARSDLRDPSRPVTVWLVGDSQLDGMIDWITGRKDPTTVGLDRSATANVLETWRNDGTEFRLVDLATPACEGGSGVARVFVGTSARDEFPECLDWQNRWGTALHEWGEPDVVVWMVGGSTVWLPRSFVGAEQHFTVPSDDEWQQWWPVSVAERLEWIDAQLADPTPVLWMTPVVPNRGEYPKGRRPSDEHWGQIVEGTEVVARLQHEIAATRPIVEVVDMAAWASSAGEDGGPLAGTYDGVHWGKRATYEQVWPFLFSHVRHVVGR